MIVAGAAGGVVLFLVMVGIVIARFYQRASADEALVRTGSGGAKVVIGGGILCLPVLHQVMRVSLRTVTLTVERVGKQALVTRDKIKAICTMELYIKVDPTEDAIVKAAQSFGSKNVDAGVLSEIVEGKLTDALRGVAAVKDFAELHAKREEFAEAVKEALVEELAKNGLKLESTSLTNLSQLPIEQMDKDDVFDAVGLRNILQTVADAQQESNQIEKNRDVTIQEQNVKARETALRLEKEKEFLEANQQREVAEYQAEQATTQKKVLLAKEQEAKEADLEQKRNIESTKIAQDEAVATRELQKLQAIAEAQATKDEAERTAQIRATKAVEAAQIEKQKAIEAAQIEKMKAIETAQIEKEVAIAVADTEKAKAEAEKAFAEAKETEARETIKTAEEKAQADRTKTIAIIKAQEQLEQAQIEADRERYVEETKAKADLTVAQQQAEAEKAQAEGKANAVRESAKAEADKRRVAAQAVKDAAELEAEAEAVKIQRRAEAESQAATLDAEAKKLLADARLKEGQAEAETKRLLVEAENAVDNRILMLRAAEKAMLVAPDVVREFVKSAEAIGEMKVLQINGLNGLSGGGGDEGGFMGEMAKTPLGMGIATLAQYAAISPVLKGLLEHSGVDTNKAAGDLIGKAKEAIKAGVDEFTNNSNNNRLADVIEPKKPKAKKKPSVS
jgi:uncharacterized membrane protein YqiK